jgi:hypothetical protein
VALFPNEWSANCFGETNKLVPRSALPVQTATIKPEMRMSKSEKSPKLEIRNSQFRAALFFGLRTSDFGFRIS